MKTNTKRTKNEAIEIVTNSYPSIWSKDDVLLLLNSIEDSGINDEKLDELKDKIFDIIDELDSHDIVDFDSARFDLNGNEICLDSIDLFTNSIKNNINEAFN